MASSIDRVRAAAASAGLDIDIRTMPDSTRTAEEAAAACGCAVAQIVKSLVFERESGAGLVLLLVPGHRQADLARASALAGGPLGRADPRRVREVTGFAIGGVSPIGHLAPLPCWIDRSLLGFDIVWAAAGSPQAVFAAEPNSLARAAGATTADLV